MRVETASGGIDVWDLHGTTVVTTASGGIRMTNVSGDVRATYASGGIQGDGVHAVSEARSLSGGIDLNGDFATNAQITSVSGSVRLELTPASSVHIDAASLSVSAHQLALTAQQSGPHSLSGNIGSAAATVAVRTTSGSIQLLLPRRQSLQCDGLWRRRPMFAASLD